jgi:hypothetical protein
VGVDAAAISQHVHSEQACDTYRTGDVIEAMLRKGTASCVSTRVSDHTETYRRTWLSLAVRVGWDAFRFRALLGDSQLMPDGVVSEGFVVAAGRPHISRVTWCRW